MRRPKEEQRYWYLTQIVIAHRLSTIQNADVIYVVDKGHVAEYGNHSSLLKEGGIYSDLVNQQNL